MPPLNVCIQVNINREPGKSGVSSQEMKPLANLVHKLPGLSLRGIMGISEKTSHPGKQRQAFFSLAQLYRQLRETYGNIDTLSMGMSDDMEAAIAEGSTMVRIGTAIFGVRKAKQVGD